MSLTDPDSRVMRTGKGGVVGYNVQIAVDVKHSLIAEQQVYNNLTGFGVCAYPSGSKYYVVQTRANGKAAKRVTVGRHGIVTAEEARRRL